MDEACHDSKLKERYYLIDSIRGILITGVVLYHAFFDYAAFFGISAELARYMPIIYLIRDVGCFLFVFIAGVSVHFGKKRFKRSLLIFCCGLLVSIVTNLAVPEMAVVFGVLSFIGTAGLIMIPLEGILKKINPVLGFVLSLLLFLITFNIIKGYLGFGRVSIHLPESLYNNFATAILGFPPSDFESSDYFPIFPWIFAYFTGYYLWKYISAKQSIPSFFKKRVPFFATIGKYTLWIYLAHQPLLFGITALIYSIVY